MERVLYILSNEPIGGVGAVVKNYHKHFQKDIIAIDFLIFDPNRATSFNQEAEKMGSKIYVLPTLKIKNFFCILKELKAFWKEHMNEYKIVHLHSANIAWLCFPKLKKYGVKYRIVHSHATLYADKKLNALRNWILCLPLNKICDIKMACSKKAAEFLFGKESLNEVIIVKNAIDCRKFKYNLKVRDNIRTDYKLNEKFVIGHVGRFNEQKNHIFLIEIFCEILKKNNDAVLMLVGDGPLFDTVVSMVKKKGLQDKVLFLGQRGDVSQLLQAMDVFVLPSLFEGLPVIGIEAQASGLPCVVSTAVTREMEIANVMYVSLEETPDVWAEVIVNTKHNYNREEGCQVIAEAGYDIEKEALKLQEFYLSLD